MTAPLAHRGILAAILLAFARGLGEFGATIMVAGNIPGQTQTIPLLIYNRVQVGDEAAAIRMIVASPSAGLDSVDGPPIPSEARRRVLIRLTRSLSEKQCEPLHPDSGH